MPDDSSVTPPAYALIAVAAPVAQPLTYLVPAQMANSVAPGVEVIVPLGKRKIRGYVLETAENTEIQDPKEIIEITSTGPRFSDRDLQFYRWTASYYHYPLGKALSETVPESIVPSGITLIGLKSPVPSLDGLSAKQAAVVEYLIIHGHVSAAELRLQVSASPAVIAALVRKDIVEKTQAIRSSEPVAPLPTRPDETDIILNDRQNQALKPIKAAIVGGKFSSFLLHGVTGSGKTEVYLQAMEESLRFQRGAIYLVPEIALTPQLLARIRARFPGEPMAVIHSGISKATRRRQWQEILDGRIRIVLGARSAIFAPLKDVGVIIVDEEHDPSYKQDERLKYNARDLALVKGRLFGTTVVLGSATPDIQTYHNATKGKYRLLSLPERVLSRPLPPVTIVDLKKYGGKLPFSEPMAMAIRRNLAAGGQTLLFLNRRGFNTLVVCTSCGYVFRCRNCSISLTHHQPLGSQKPGTLTCHHCGYRAKVSDKCPDCQKDSLRRIGLGTERVEEEVVRAFPGARVSRMDRDSITGKDSYQQILDKLGAGEMDILVGTQMITKGHDFPGVTLIGVILADISLNLPDFRAAERTFQLLTQMSGRGGRGDTPGQVLIQTMNPDHYAIVSARRHDYETFYQEEIRLRRPLGYPPFSRLVNFHISSRDADEGAAGAALLGIGARELCRDATIEVTGPAESPLGMIKGRYRWQLMLKGQNMASLHRFTGDIMALAVRIPGITVKVDVDPIDFM